MISTNESYRAAALGRGGKRPDEVTVVRTGPDPDRLRRRDPDPAARRGHRHLAAYIGVMGPQDGVDVVLRAAAVVVHDLGREDIGFTLIGSGDAFTELVALSERLGLADHVHFTGRAPDEEVFRVLSTADVGLSPDPKNPLNDVSTMNKTMEYMAFELPVVAFDLVETRVSAGDAAVYVEPNVVEEYAKAIVALVDDESRRREMGAAGRARVEEHLAWHHQRAAYVGVYDRLVGRRGRAGADGGPGPDAQLAAPTPDPQG
ncbi:MAG: glycosyltransferase [Acidimicrobiales bacterium]